VDSNGPCERCLGSVVDIEDAVLRHEGMKLLLVVRDSRWQRSDVPVQVRFPC